VRSDLRAGNDIDLAFMDGHHIFHFLMDTAQLKYAVDGQGGNNTHQNHDGSAGEKK
jgi:hypothetical protein